MITDRPDTLVRWATRWDREAVTDLLTALAHMHGDPISRDDLHQALEFALRNPDEVRFCVAERQREIVGVASLHRTYSTWRARHVGTIQDVYVVESARRTGVATAMLHFIHQHALRRGFCRLELQVQRHNSPAWELYTRYGFADSGYAVLVLGLQETAASEDG